MVLQGTVMQSWAQYSSSGTLGEQYQMTWTGANLDDTATEAAFALLIEGQE